MSSYLTFYLVPKKTKKNYFYSENGEEESEIKLSEGLPLTFMSYSRNTAIYQIFDENMSIAFCGNEEKYTEITSEDMHRIYETLNDEIQNLENKLKIDYKIIKECGCSSEMWEQIHSTEEFLKEQKQTLIEIQNISNIINEITNSYNDFEKIVANID